MRRRFTVTAGLLMLLAGALVSAGCEKPLFPADLPRSQYERYEQLRGERRQTVRKNAYGYEEPNLRERLRPLEQNY